MARRKKPDEEPPTENGHPAGVEQAAVATAEPPADVQPEANGQAPEPVTNRPCKSFTCAISAGVYAEASIWPKELTMDGRTFTVFSCTVRKNYRTDEGWRNTQFFRGSELFIVRHLLESAERWILAQRTEEEPPF